MTEAVQAFEAHLRFKRKAERTIIQYRPVLHAFAEWAGERTPASVTTFEIQSFLEFWLTKFLERNAREPSNHAVKGVVVAPRSCYRYLHAYGLLLVDGQPVPNPMLAIELPVIEQKQNDWLRQAEDEALLDAYAASEDEQMICLVPPVERRAHRRGVIASNPRRGSSGGVDLRSGLENAQR